MAGPTQPWHFKPGNPGGGRPKDILSRNDVKQIMYRLAKMTKVQVEELIADKTTPMLDLTVAAIFLKAANDADHNRLGYLLDRTIGKVREEVHIEVDEPDRRAQRAFAKELLSDPETFGAVSILAARASRHQLQLDNERRDAERQQRAERVAAGD